MDISSLTPIEGVCRPPDRVEDKFGCSCSCERTSAPFQTTLLGLFEYPYSTNMPSPCCHWYAQPACLKFWRQIWPETEMMDPQALQIWPETETEMMEPQALHPCVPETEMMSPLAPNQQETEKRALWPTCSTMALESRLNQLPWCQNNRKPECWHPYPPPYRK